MGDTTERRREEGRWSEEKSRGRVMEGMADECTKMELSRDECIRRDKLTVKEVQGELGREGERGEEEKGRERGERGEKEREREKEGGEKERRKKERARESTKERERKQ